jgi:hypothetical protein
MDGMIEKKNATLQDSGNRPVSRRNLLKVGSTTAAGVAFLGLGLLSGSSRADDCGGGCNPCGNQCAAGCNYGCDSSPCAKTCSPGVPA